MSHAHPNPRLMRLAAQLAVERGSVTSTALATVADIGLATASSALRRYAAVGLMARGAPMGASHAVKFTLTREGRAWLEAGAVRQFGTQAEAAYDFGPLLAAWQPA